MSIYMFGALLGGLIIGAIPAIAGGVKGKLWLGLGGLAACVVGSILLGMILSIPLCAIFMYFIFKKDNMNAEYLVSATSDQQQGTTPAAGPNITGNSDITEQFRKLTELRDAGFLTEEEFQQRKSMLLNRL